MAPDRLLGMRIALWVAEPWDFLEAHGDGPFFGRVLQVGLDYWPFKFNNQQVEAVLIQLDAPMLIDGVNCEYFIAGPRHETGNVRSVEEGSEVICGLTCIPEERAIGNDPFDLSWWRDGIGLIGVLRPA